MDNMDKVLMFKNVRTLEEVNDVYIKIRELDNHFIVKKYDTIRCEEKDVLALEKDYIDANLYSLRDFFKNSVYIGKSGYYKDQGVLEKYIYKTIILVYKDEYNEIMYDTILRNFYVTPSLFPIEDFVPFKEQNNNVRFKKGLNKK